MAVSDISTITFGSNTYNLKDPTKYVKPAGGIPYSDLENSVKARLDKADTALQEHQSLAAYRTAEAQDAIDSGKLNANSKGVAGGVAELDANGKVPVAQCPIEEDVAQATADWLDEHIAQETGYVIDDSLTVTGAAADAKAVGDLKSAINAAISTDNLFDKNAIDIEPGKYIRANGTLSTSGIGSVSGYIPVIPNTTLVIYPVVTQNWYCNYCSANAAKSVRDTVPLANVSELVIPENTYFIRITFLTASANEVMIKYKNTDALAIKNAGKISALDNDIENHYAKIESIDRWTQGTINSDGSINQNATARIASGWMYAFDGLIVPMPGYSVMACVFDKDDTYLGYYDGNDIIQTAHYFDTFIPVYNLPENYQIRVALRKDDLSDITPESAGDKAFIVKYQLNTFRRLPIKQKSQTINGVTHCAFPSMCYFAGKKIIAYRYSKSHYTPQDSADWGGFQIDSIVNGLVVKHEISIDRTMFTGLDGEFRGGQIGVSDDGNYMILAGWTTYYVNDERRFDNLLVCINRNFAIVNYQVFKHPANAQPYKFCGTPLFTPTGHLIVTGYNYTNETSSADNQVILWRSQEVFSGDVSTLTMYQSATITDFDDAGEATIGYIGNKLATIFRRQQNNSFIKFSDDLEGTTDFGESEADNYDVGAAIHNPMILPHSSGNNLFFVGAKLLPNSKRETVLGYFDIVTNTVKEIRGIDDINYNYGGYAGFVSEGDDKFCIVYYIEDTSVSKTNGQTGLFLKYVNGREILSSLNRIQDTTGDAIAAKLTAPTAAGTAGQILGLDNQLNPTWQDRDRVVTVTGTTPTITAEANTRYVCGEVTTLDIALPASGVVDVTFESGSVPTVLTVTPPSGVTLKWANGFDPDNLAANTSYQIRVTDGEFGVATVYGVQPTQVDYELIAHVTLSEETKRVDITEDYNGDPFELERVYALYIPHTSVAAANLLIYLDAIKDWIRLSIAYKPGVKVNSYVGVFSSRDMYWTLFGANYSGNGSVFDTYISVPTYNLEPEYRTDYVRAIIFSQNISFPVGSEFKIYGKRRKV